MHDNVSNVMSWTAICSDGSRHIDQPARDTSSWQELILHCKKNNIYIEHLSMPTKYGPAFCPSNAVGYWHAKAIRSTQGSKDIEELCGIGWVENNMLNIIWKNSDSQTWVDRRSIEGQKQIIWGCYTGLGELNDL